MLNKPQRIPKLHEIFGVESDKKHSQLWRDFAKTMVGWSSYKNYTTAMAHFCVAFDTAKKLFGKEAALAVYKAITDDVCLKPDEIIQAAKYLHDGGDKTAITELAAESYFLEYDNSKELCVDYCCLAYEMLGSAQKKDLCR